MTKTITNYGFTEDAIATVKKTIQLLLKAEPRLAGWGMISQRDSLSLSMLQLRYMQPFETLKENFDQSSFNKDIQLIQKLRRAIVRYNKKVTKLD